MNTVYLIGVVGSPTTIVTPVWSMVVVIAQEHDGGLHVERIRVVGGGHLAGVVRNLQTAQLVYIDGQLGWEAGRALVTATTVMPLAQALEPPAMPAVTGRHHASPVPHDRIGHPRTIHRGTARERVVIVRPARIGSHVSNDLAARRVTSRGDG